MSTAPKIVRHSTTALDTTQRSAWITPVSSTATPNLGWDIIVDPRNRKARREPKAKGPAAKFKHNRIYIP